MIEWEDMPATPDTVAAPAYCTAGPFSHVWYYELDYDGSTLWTEECEQCNAVANSMYADITEHMVACFKVTLHPRIERGLETDFFIDMIPEPPDECSP